MLKTNASNRWVIPMIIAVLIVVLWSTKILASGLCVLVASRHVRDNYPMRRFEYSFVEYSSAHGEYFVHFVGQRVTDWR